MLTHHFEKTAINLGLTLMPAIGAGVGATVGGEDAYDGTRKNQWIGALRGGTSFLTGEMANQGVRRLGGKFPLALLADVVASSAAWYGLRKLGPQYEREKYMDEKERIDEMIRKTAGFQLSSLHSTIDPAVPKKTGYVDTIKNVMPRPGGKAKYKNSLINAVTFKQKPKMGSLGAADDISGANKG